MIRVEMTDADLIHRLDFVLNDSMLAFVTADGLFRGAVFNGTRFVNQMRLQHNLGILETMVLGQASLSAALMIQTMKGRESLQLRYETDGLARGFAVEAFSDGFVRGHLLQEQIPIDKPLESWNLSPFFGKGFVSVIRYPEKSKGFPCTPQKSMTEIVYGDIAKDIARYFLCSEQLYTAFNTGIQLDCKGRVIGAGGLFIQRMPLIGGNIKKNMVFEDDVCPSVQAMERAVSAAPSLGQWFSEGGSCEDLMYGLFREFSPQPVATRSVIFHCPCSQEYYRSSIMRMPAETIQTLVSKENLLEIVCKNCASVYHISLDALSSFVALQRSLQ